MSIWVGESSKADDTAQREWASSSLSGNPAGAPQNKQVEVGWTHSLFELIHLSSSACEEAFSCFLPSQTFRPSWISTPASLIPQLQSMRLLGFGNCMRLFLIMNQLLSFLLSLPFSQDILLVVWVTPTNTSWIHTVIDIPPENRNSWNIFPWNKGNWRE